MDSIPGLKMELDEDTKNATVLLLEQEDSLRRVIVLTLKQLGIDVLEASDENSARKCLERKTPDLFIINLDSPTGKKGQLIKLFREKSGDEQGAVLLTTTQRPEDKWRQRFRPDVVIYKPFDIRYLMRRIIALT
jgi:two-component system KDP operon response regulator KdpE